MRAKYLNHLIIPVFSNFTWLFLYSQIFGKEKECFGFSLPVCNLRTQITIYNLQIDAEPMDNPIQVSYLIPERQAKKA